MAEHTAVKDPDSTVNYSLKWHDWLNGDTISTSTWIIEGGESPLTLTESSNSIDTYTGASPNLPTAQTTIIVTGGTVGINYTLTNRITTDGGLTADDSILVRCWER